MKHLPAGDLYDQYGEVKLDQRVSLGLGRPLPPSYRRRFITASITVALSGLASLFVLHNLSWYHGQSFDRVAAAGAPVVQLDQAIFTGKTVDGVNMFLGIPYAQPAQRFMVPVLNTPYTEAFDASQFGYACPQQNIVLPTPPANNTEQAELQGQISKFFNSKTPLVQSEDCLNLNVYTPLTASPATKYPVVVWIYGGGFEEGAAQEYKGENMVQESVTLGKSIIYVAMNYRVSAYGFLASAEVFQEKVGNLGLRDQRLALKWVNNYIASFGGDPTQVTIWGESAGAMSVGLQMLTNGGDAQGFFRGAIMQSGSPPPVGHLTHGQSYYNALVQNTSCSNASDSLQCLRTVDFHVLKTAVDASPSFFSSQALNLAWLPRVDGDFLTDTPQNLIDSGSITRVPFISGDCDDEGTLFTLPTTSIQTESDLSAWLQTNFLPEATSADIAQILELYPPDQTAGSPFNTGPQNELSAQYMRTAAIQGDMVFQAPRRYLMQAAMGKQPMWGFLSTRFKALPQLPFLPYNKLHYLGSFHGSDLFNAYNDGPLNKFIPGGGELQKYIICFVNTLDPNGCQTNTEWPPYTLTSPTLLEFYSSPLLVPEITTTPDTYREAGIELLSELMVQYPIGRAPI